MIVPQVPLKPLAISSPRVSLIALNAVNDTSLELAVEHLVWSPTFVPQFATAATVCAVVALLVSQSPIGRTGFAGWYPLYDNIFVRTGLWSVAGLLSSSCCLLQIMLNAFSIGCAGFNTILGPARPYFMAMAFTLQILMWRAAIVDSAPLDPAIMSTALTMSLTFLPEALNAAMQSSAMPPAEDDLRLRVDGMGCTACSVKVKAALEGVEGVAGCTVAFEEGCAQLQLESKGFVAADAERASVEQRAIAALVKAGFNGALDR